MGLDDRDYMRDRHRRTLGNMLGDRGNPFTPPAQETSTLVILALWVVIGAALYAGFGWWQQTKRAEQLAGKNAALARQQQQPSHQPPPGEQAQRVEPPPRALMRQEPREAVAPRTGGTVYGCKADDGGMFWASSTCSEHGASMDRMTSVPEGLPFDQQVQIAEDRRRALETHTPVAAIVGSPSAAVPVHRGECQRLDAEVERLDAMARQPQSAQMQDWIREKRKAARDRQFRLGC